MDRSRYGRILPFGVLTYYLEESLGLKSVLIVRFSVRFVAHLYKRERLVQVRVPVFHMD